MKFRHSLLGAGVLFFFHIGGPVHSQEAPLLGDTNDDGYVDISDAIRLCGGENVFAALKPMAAAVTVEAVLAADPEAIVASGMGEERPEWLDEWRRWPALTAVGRNNLFFVHPDHLQRHTPRILDGIERLCEHLEAARARRPVK